MELDEIRKNVHQTHIESLVFNGPDGLGEINDYITDNLDQEASTTNKTTKIDGAPAILIGHNVPGYPKEFVGIKSVLNSPKNAYSTEEQIKANKPDIADKMIYGLKLAKYIPSGEIWQGDCLFNKGEVKEQNINGKDYLVFKPNTIVYAFPETNPDYEKLKNADFGICFHTIYRPSDEGFSQSFKVDLSRVNIPDNYFLLSPTLKADKEKIDPKKLKELFVKLKEAELKLLNDPYYEDICNNKAFRTYWDTFENHITSDQKLTHINKETFIKDLTDWVNEKIPADFSKRYKDQDKAAGKAQVALSELQYMIEQRKQTLSNMIDCFNLVVDVKDILISWYSGNPGYDTYLQSRTKGYIPSGGEGIALSDDNGNIVKLVNRAEFSNANRNPDIIKGFEHESLEEELVYNDNTMCYNDSMEKLYEELNRRHILRVPGYDYIPGLDEDFNYVDSVVTKEFKGSGKVDMRGHKIEGPVDLANLFSIFRDRRYETFRIIFVKDNKIVGTENVTSKLPGVTAIHKYYKNSTSDQSVSHMLVDMKTKFDRLEADGYYLFHNHPAGSDDPSSQDIKATQLFANKLPGFKGHIIEGSDTFTFINEEGKVNRWPLEDEKDYNSLGKISSAKSIARLASHYAFDDNVSLVIYSTSKLEVTAVQEVDNYEFKEQSVANYFSKQKKENGANYLFLVTKDPSILNDMSEYVVFGLFEDIIVVNNDDTVISYNQLGKLPMNKYNEIIKSYNEKYDPNNMVNTVSNTDKDPSVIATKQYHRMKTKKLKPGQMIVSAIGEELLDEKIVKKGSKWQVQSEKGRNMGTYDTKEEAEKRLQQVHYFKYKNEDYEVNSEESRKLNKIVYRCIKSLNDLKDQIEPTWGKYDISSRSLFHNGKHEVGVKGPKEFAIKVQKFIRKELEREGIYTRTTIGDHTESSLYDYNIIVWFPNEKDRDRLIDLQYLDDLEEDFSSFGNLDD